MFVSWPKTTDNTQQPVDMASASSLAFEEQLLCSICLHEFTEPVSTPCGHNYCKACITGYWATNDLTECPLCKKQFYHRPQLQVNTEFRDMAERFNNMRLRGKDNTLAKPGEVPCDICPWPKFKAQKTCLLCLSSYCQFHLELHRGVTAHMKHQLIDPVSNLGDRVCKKHNKVFELFCHRDQVCVCSVCLKDDHAMHKAVPLEREIAERKAHLDDVAAEIKTLENAKSRSIEEVKCKEERSKKQSQKEMEDIDEVFTDLILSLQRKQFGLVELIKEKQEEAEKQAKDNLTKLKQEIALLRKRRSEIEELLQTKDDLQLLQSCLSLDFPVEHGYKFDPICLLGASLSLPISDVSRQSYAVVVRKAVAQVEKSFSNEMETLIHEVRLSNGSEVIEPCGAAEKPVSDRFIKEVWNPPQDKLMMIQQCNAVDVTMDAYTAHPSLVVSGNGKQLRVRDGQLHLHALFGHRFRHHKCVLGEDGFSSGRFYFEVRVPGCSCWILGVVKESFDRELMYIPGPEEGYWTFAGFNPLLQTVGVFVDHEKGEVSFYNVDTRTQIYSYTGCNFKETTPALKTFLYSMAGTHVSSRLKLFPCLGIMEGLPIDGLEIIPVTH
uniref:E3 ubiquitin-protein ligase TRIM39-like n=1 Tax=Labrus bergylta TaxID=56723 RepID=A0A3Q3FK90_9LABR|nr:E3 ubiquitin-protein ligase TRIM39-like [Labrus bergylta]